MNETRRSRVWNRELGAGTLVWQEPGAWMCYEGDDGRVHRWQWSSISRGRSPSAAVFDPNHEDSHWLTVETRTGATIVFRDKPESGSPWTQGELLIDRSFDTVTKPGTVTTVGTLFITVRDIETREDVIFSPVSFWSKFPNEPLHVGQPVDIVYAADGRSPIGFRTS